MVRQATLRLHLDALVAAGSLLLALGTGRPEIAVLGLPFAVVLVLGLAAARPLDIDVDVDLDDTVAIEGDTVNLHLTFRSRAGVPWLEVTLAGPAALTPEDGVRALAVSVPAGGTAEVTFPLRCRRWGVHRPGSIRLRAFDTLRLFEQTETLVPPGTVRVHPTLDRLRAVVQPDRLQGLTGSHVSRQRGEGFDYADTRPFVPGDRVRAVNWRVSARRDDLWVSDRHPDRNGDVVLFLDTFAEAGWSLDSTLDLAVEAVIACAEAHLAVNDRVGLVGLGGVLRWVVPGMGRVQLHKVVDTVLDTQVIASDADKSLDVVPVRGLPGRALVLAVTPLLDRRSLALLYELRGRGFDLAVIECSPVPFTPPSGRPAAAAAHRLWCLEREVTREQLRSLGIVVTEWVRPRPFAEVVDEVRRWRRLPRLVLR